MARIRIAAAELEAGDTILRPSRFGDFELIASAVVFDTFGNGATLVTVEGLASVKGSPYTTPRLWAFGSTEAVEVIR